MFTSNIGQGLICMGSNRFKHSFVSALILLTILLASCREHVYPTDNEQLSHEEQIVIRFSHVVGEIRLKEWQL